jgi:hypothetical protein
VAQRVDASVVGDAEQPADSRRLSRRRPGCGKP